MKHIVNCNDDKTSGRAEAPSVLPKDRTLVGWSAALRAAGNTKLAAGFNSNVVRDFYLLNLLDLPTYDAHLLPCVDFITNFKWFESNFNHKRYYLNLIPVREDLRKLSLVDFGALVDAKDFIQEQLRGSCGEYMVRISEFETNVYGGSIMSDNHTVIAELALGLQHNVAYGSVPVITAHLSEHVKSVQYTTNESAFRELLWRPIDSIRFRGASRADDSLKIGDLHECGRYWFWRGYFEFAYTRREERAPLRLVFFDVKLQSSFCVLRDR